MDHIEHHQKTPVFNTSKESNSQTREDGPAWGLAAVHTEVGSWDLLCFAVYFQNKDLKSRVGHLESSQKSSKEGLVVQLESRIQQLEERLEGEER